MRLRASSMKILRGSRSEKIAGMVVGVVTRPLRHLADIVDYAFH